MNQVHMFLIFHMFHMIHDLACIFTMDIIDIMISMMNISLYVIIMLLIYGIKMTWKLPIILTGDLELPLKNCKFSDILAA